MHHLASGANRWCVRFAWDTIEDSWWRIRIIQPLKNNETFTPTMKHEAHYCVRNGQDEGFADLAHWSSRWRLILALWKVWQLEHSVLPLWNLCSRKALSYWKNRFPTMKNITVVLLNHTTVTLYNTRNQDVTGKSHLSCIGSMVHILHKTKDVYSRMLLVYLF